MDPFYLSETLCHEPAFVFIDLINLVKFALKDHFGFVRRFPFLAIHQLPRASCPSTSRLMDIFQCSHSGIARAYLTRYGFSLPFVGRGGLPQ